MNIGDKVQYVPDLCHALIANTGDFPAKGIRVGEYPWVIEDSDGIELTAPEVTKLLKIMRNRKRTPEQMGLKFVRPAVMWPAVVREVLPDGRVRLDVDAPDSAVILHVTIVTDSTGTKPHTCFVPKVTAPPVVEEHAAPPITIHE